MAKTKRTSPQAQHAGRYEKKAREGARDYVVHQQAVQNASQQSDEFVKEFLISHEKV